jgi:hypothetical protein
MRSLYDVTHFQVREFGTPESRGIEGHQQCAMQGRSSRIDESRDFILAKNRWPVNVPLRVGRLCDAPGPLERLAVEKT